MTLPKPLNRYIDHTLLKPNATHDQFETLLDEAIEYKFASLCVAPYMAVPSKGALNSTGSADIKVGTVVGFPHGNTPLALKVYEADYYMERGIDEIDFVLNYGELKNRNIKAVLYDFLKPCALSHGFFILFIGAGFHQPGDLHEIIDTFDSLEGCFIPYPVLLAVHTRRPLHGPALALAYV